MKVIKGMLKSSQRRSVKNMLASGKKDWVGVVYTYKLISNVCIEVTDRSTNKTEIVEIEL